ncbi:MAG: hypothetical protein M3Z09_10560 [Acidobacteriota bacterium]|nr:hypothetical protein [Acidobacteriota bacterium]
MEIQKVIEYLNQQRSMIDETIVCLERLSEGVAVHSVSAPAKRRGRKFMDANDRQKVSERMKEYWAMRRGQRTHSASGGA